VKKMLSALTAAGVIAALVFAYLTMIMSKERKAGGEAGNPVVAESRVHSGTNGETILTLDVEAQKLSALSVEPVTSGEVRAEKKGYGRVLDPVPLATLAAELASAQAASAASQQEFERLKLLHGQQNASDRALQTAEATARADSISVEAIRARLALGWGKAIAERTNLSAFVQSLVLLDSALVRIDLPAGELLNGLPVGARIIASSSETHSVPAQFVSPAPNVDPQVQGQGFLFLVTTNSARLIPGRSVEGHLQLPGEPLHGFIVPDSAVVRDAGRGWVYIQTGAETFTRREIPLDHPLERGWFVQKGLGAKDRLVARGAQALLSEEQKYQIKLLD
jgi:hypothetical protein